MIKRILCRAGEVLTSCESGQAMIETAISSLFLIVLLLGAVDLGMVTYAAIEVANSAKAAAQYAAMNGGAWTRRGLDTVGMLAAAQADAGNLVSDIAFTSAPTYTCRCTGAGVANCTTAPPSGCMSSHLLVTVTVRTQESYTPPIRVPGFNFPHILLKGSAQEEVLE